MNNVMAVWERMGSVHRLHRPGNGSYEECRLVCVGRQTKLPSLSCYILSSAPSEKHGCRCGKFFTGWLSFQQFRVPKMFGSLSLILS
jgi:hypothetical protein